MAWLSGIVDRIKAPFLPDERELDAHAIALFAQSAAQPGHTSAEQVWLGEFLRRLRAVETRGATGLWLDAVESNAFLLDATDKVIQSLRTALVVDSKPQVLNGRRIWETFVVLAIVANDRDISAWEQRTRWFKAVLDHLWKTDVQYKDATPDSQESARVYIERTAETHVWARDLLLEYRVLYLAASNTLDAMFQGPGSSSLPFITALAGIGLRMHQSAPSDDALDLHRRAHAAWPHEMAQVEATLQVQAWMDEMELESSARIAQSMELSRGGYSTYLPFFGESVHRVMRDYIGKKDERIALPVLD